MISPENNPPVNFPCVLRTKCTFGTDIAFSKKGWRHILRQKESSLRKAAPISLLSSLAFCFIALTSFLPAQPATAEPGELTGRVLAADGSGLQGATVILTAVRTGAIAKAVTGEGGVYRFPGLPPGAYDLWVEAPGFKPAAKAGVTVAASGTGTGDFRLEFATIPEDT